MPHELIITMLLYVIAIPIIFAIVLIIFYKILTLFHIPVKWIQEAERLDPETFLNGQVFTQFEFTATPPKEKYINQMNEVRCSDTDYIYIYKWLNDNELIFMRKYSPKSIWADFLNSFGSNRIPELRTKNHVRFDEGKSIVTALYLKGGLTFQWFAVLFIPVLTILGLLNDFSWTQIFITIFFAIPFSKWFYDAVTKLPRVHIKRGLELITVQN